MPTDTQDPLGISSDPLGIADDPLGVSQTSTATTPATSQPISENVGLPSPVEALRQDPRYYRKPPGMIETAFGAVGEVAAAALNIPQAMVRSATGETPKQFKISTDETGKEQLTQEEVPLHFQAGKPAIQFRRTEMQPEGNAIGRLIEGLMTPENIALFPLSASRTVQAAFLSQMAPAAVEAASRLVAPETPPEERREASTELLINGLMTYGIARHMATKKVPPELARLAPATAKATAETVKTTEPQVATFTESLTPATDAATASPKPKESVPATAETVKETPSQEKSPWTTRFTGTINLWRSGKRNPKSVWEYGKPGVFYASSREGASFYVGTPVEYTASTRNPVFVFTPKGGKPPSGYAQLQNGKIVTTDGKIISVEEFGKLSTDIGHDAIVEIPVIEGGPNLDAATVFIPHRDIPEGAMVTQGNNVWTKKQDGWYSPTGKVFEKSEPWLEQQWIRQDEPATAETVKATASPKPKENEPAPGQLPVSLEGTAPEAGVTAPKPSEFTPKQQARQESSRLETEANMRRELEGGEAGAIGTPGPPLAPAPTSSTPLTPKSQRQIITDIAKGLNIPIRFGRLTTSKFAGYFKSVENLIGSKRADDIPIVSHEAGHKLDKSFGFSADPSLAAELNVLGDPATPGSRSSWTKSKTTKYKLDEGVAEFVRNWLTDPANAKRVAPNTFTAFERALDSNKDFGDTMRQAQQDIALWRSADPQARLRSQISVGENPNQTRYTASQLTRDLVDDLHILRLATKDAAKGAPLNPSSDPYLLARNLRGSYGMAATFIRDGVVDFKTKEVRLGTGLEDALKPVAGRLNDFRDWIVAKRAQELRAQGRESGLVSTDVDAVARKFDADPEFLKTFQAVRDWNDSLLKYAEDSGLLTPEAVTAMRDMNRDYVPFHRVFEVGAGEMPSQQSGGVGAGLNVGKPGSLKGLKGSPRQIVDPMETMVKNAYTIITASEKAAINHAVADMANLPDMGKWVERIASPKENVKLELAKIRKQLEAAGADLSRVPDDLALSFFRQSGGTPFGENIIRINRNGKAEYYRLNRDLYDTFKALDIEDAGKITRMLAAPSQLLRAGVTLDPAFSLANVMRDTFSAAVIGKYGAFPFETTLKGVAAMVNNPKLVAEWAASGGKSAVEHSYFDRTKLQKLLAERISKDLTPAERALIVTRSPLSALRWISTVFEESTRIGEYKIAYEKLRKGGMPEGEARRQASFEARDRQDFSKGGARTKFLRHTAAFWNAGLQANVKLAQAFKERPVRTTLQGLAFITIPKLLEQAINWDDKDYWARKQWERDLFFLIPIGKDKSGHTRFLRIPTPFEVGLIFGTFPGRILQALREKDPKAMQGFPSLMLKQSVPNPIPQYSQVIFEDFLSGKKGWDVWRGRTIVPESLADEPPELQYTEQTSAIAKKVGEAVKFSPMKVDHLIERTTGGMGKLLTGRSVPGQRFVTAPLPVSNQATETFYDRLEAIREDAARAKAKNEAAPADYKAFQATEKVLSELRKRTRATTDLDQKAKYQEKILQVTTEFLKNHPKK